MPLVFEATTEPGRRCCSTLLVEAAFDFEILDDGFDDQVAVFEFRQIVFKVSDSDERGAIGGKEGGGFGFPGGFKSGARDALRSLLRDGRLSTASSRGTMSSNKVGTPALARCAAICAPIVPAPSTAAFFTCIMAGR